MPAIAIRKTAWQAGNDDQKAVLRYALRRLNLGVPAEYETGGTVWYIFHDSRIGLHDAEIMGTVANGLATFSNYQLPTIIIQDEDGNDIDTGRVDRVAAKAQIHDWVANNSTPWQTVDLVDDDGQSLGDPYTLILNAQSAPAWIKAAESVPASWTPVETP